jgi:hypothetical protein
VKAKPTIIDVMDGPLADSFEGPSWDRWRAILKGAFGLPMTEDELESFREVTDRDPPGNRVRELWVVGGRRGGKDSVASLIIAHAASLFDGKRRQIAGLSLPALRRGERATIFCFGRDRDQARLVLGYVRDYFASIHELKAMVTRETRDGFELSNGVDVIIGTGDYRSHSSSHHPAVVSRKASRPFSYDKQWNCSAKFRVGVGNAPKVDLASKPRDGDRISYAKQARTADRDEPYPRPSPPHDRSRSFKRRASGCRGGDRAANLGISGFCDGPPNPCWSYHSKNREFQRLAGDHFRPYFQRLTR